MGFLPSMLGIGNSGMNYSASGTNIQQPLSASNYLAQLSSANDRNAELMNYANQLRAAGAQGFGTQANVLGQQQVLANQYADIVAGRGPNPAQAMLNNATGQNIAQQGALMAGQRGANANVGLMARQAAQQGAGIQQNAVGQAAQLQAQQQLGAMQAQAAQQQAMQAVAANQTSMGLQGAGAAATNVNNIMGQVGNMLSGQNQANVGMQSNINATNAGIQGKVAGAQQGLLGGLLGGAGIASSGGGQGAAASSFAHGGAVPNGPRSAVGKHFSNYKMGGRIPGKAQVSGDSLKNDTVPAMLSPGEIVVPRSAAKDPKKAAAFAHAVSMRGKK